MTEIDEKNDDFVCGGCDGGLWFCCFFIFFKLFFKLMKSVDIMDDEGLVYGSGW